MEDVFTSSVRAPWRSVLSKLLLKRSELISIVVIPSMESATLSFCTKRFIWSFIETIPFIKFIELFHSSWKTHPKVQGLLSKLKINMKLNYLCPSYFIAFLF